MTKNRSETNKAGQRLALVIAGVALLWLGASYAGAALGWSSRTGALFDLIALAGFAWAFFIAIGMWRARQKDKG